MNKPSAHSRPTAGLALDARQRAMLQEMGITLWSARQAAVREPKHHLADHSAFTEPASPAPTLSSRTGSAAATHRTLPHEHAASLPPSDAPANAASMAWVLHPPVALYPLADPTQAPASLGNGWLIVSETSASKEPFSGDAGHLLDNMLRAMQLHRHPRVFLAALERLQPQHSVGMDLQNHLASTIAALQPAMVLVLGHVAARAVLNRTEHLGRLRTEPHAVADCPAIVTYDPAFLLRSQETKAAAWADLCKALAIVRTNNFR